MSNENPVTAALARTLASTYALALKTQNYHWNVEGPHFAALHTLFEGQYEALHAAADELAERMRALGAYAPGGLAAFAAASAVPDAPGDPPAGPAMIADLADGHRTASAEAARTLRIAQEADDEVTVDMMVGRMTEHDKAAWMLSAHLN